MRKRINNCLMATMIFVSLATPSIVLAHDVLVVPITHGNISIEPDGVVDHSSSLVLNQIYDGLINLNEDFEIVPELASSWMISLDRKHYVFNLNRSLLYDHNKHISGSAIKAYYEWMLRQHPEKRWIFEGVEGLDEFLSGKSTDISGIVVSLDKVIFKLHKPSHIFLFCLASTSARIGFREDVGGEFYGTGPYRLYAKETGAIVLAANELNLRGREATIKKVRFVFGKSSTELIEDFERGHVTLMQLDLNEEVMRQQLRGHKLIEFPNYTVDLLGLNYKRMTASLRRLIASAIDKDLVVRQSGLYGAVRSDSLVPPDLSKGNVLSTRSGGRDLLVGKGNGKRALKFLVSEVYYNKNRSVFRQLQRMWSDKMLRVDFDICKHAVYIDKLYKGGFDIAYVRYLGDYPDPDAFYYPLLHSGGQFNFMKYANEIVDQLLELSREMTSDEDRMAIYNIINSKLLADPIVVPLYNTKVAILMQPEIELIAINGQGIWYLDVSQIRMKN